MVVNITFNKNFGSATENPVAKLISSNPKCRTQVAEPISDDSSSGNQTQYNALNPVQNKYSIIEQALAKGWHRINSPQSTSFGILHLGVTEAVSINGFSAPQDTALARLSTLQERDQRDRERQLLQAQVAENTYHCWLQASPAAPYPHYLCHKKLPPYSLRQRLPTEVVITIYRDDDRPLSVQGRQNNERVAARHAALAIDAKMLIPSFCEECLNCTDFSDVLQCRLRVK